MPAVQPLLPLPRPARARVRSLRRPFTPSKNAGPYRLPHDVWDRLVSSLAPARNRDAALALAVFIGRFWSTPSRITSAFPIDRRELANRPDLGLTEAQVRGAIRALEAVDFLDRVIPGKGSRHKLTGAGELHRRPVLFQFGSDYAVSFSRVEPCGYTVRGRAVTTTNATQTSDMNPKPTTSNMSMVLPEERASPLREMGSARAGRLPLFVNCAAWMCR